MDTSHKQKRFIFHTSPEFSPVLSKGCFNYKNSSGRYHEHNLLILFVCSHFETERTKSSTVCGAWRAEVNSKCGLKLVYQRDVVSDVFVSRSIYSQGEDVGDKSSCFSLCPPTVALVTCLAKHKNTSSDSRIDGCCCFHSLEVGRQPASGRGALSVKWHDKKFWPKTQFWLGAMHKTVSVGGERQQLHSFHHAPLYQVKDQRDETAFTGRGGAEQVNRTLMSCIQNIIQQ